MGFKNLAFAVALVCGVSSAFADDAKTAQDTAASRFFMADRTDMDGVGTVGGASPLMAGFLGRGLVRAHSDGSISRRSMILSEVPSDLELRGMVIDARNRYALSHLQGGKIMVNFDKSVMTGERSYKTVNLPSRYIEIQGRSDEAVLRDLKGVFTEGAENAVTGANVGFFSKSAQVFSKGFLATGAVAQGAGVAWDLGHLTFRAIRHHELSQGQCGPTEQCENDKLLRETNETASSNAPTHISASAAAP